VVRRCCGRRERRAPPRVAHTHLVLKIFAPRSTSPAGASAKDAIWAHQKQRKQHGHALGVRLNGGSARDSSHGAAQGSTGRTPVLRRSAFVQRRRFGAARARKLRVKPTRVGSLMSSTRLRVRRKVFELGLLPLTPLLPRLDSPAALQARSLLPAVCVCMHAHCTLQTCGTDSPLSRRSAAAARASNGASWRTQSQRTARHRTAAW
jgi:hypothetical protein